MNPQADKDLIELRKRIASLEINNTLLKREVQSLKEKVIHAKSSNRDQSRIKAHTVVDHSTKKKAAADPKRTYKKIEDRDRTEIDIGSRVHILTPGAFTKQSSRGRITGVNDIRNQVFILNKCGVTQERPPNNVRLDRW